jgi:hypothetical protein
MAGWWTIPTDAWAAYCRASSAYGSWGWGRSHSYNRARAIALASCAVRTRRGYMCYIRYCR